MFVSVIWTAAVHVCAMIFPYVRHLGVCDQLMRCAKNVLQPMAANHERELRVYKRLYTPE